MKFTELTDDQIIELSNNRSCEDIINLEKLLRESIRHYLSRFLMDTSEDNPYTCDLTLDIQEVGGLSSLEQPHVTGMYQAGGEGIIFVKFEGISFWVRLDTICLEEQVELIKAFEQDK